MTHRNQNQWDEWFAGVVDGECCFYINKKNEVSFELTSALTESRVLLSIKHRLKAGTIKYRSGSLSIRYRVKQRHVLKDICHRLNGQLRHPIHQKKFRQACELLDVPWQPCYSLSPTSGYLSGLFDSDGSVAMTVTRTTAEDSQKSKKQAKMDRLVHSGSFHQWVIQISSTEKAFLYHLRDIYGYGKIDIQKTNRRNKHPRQVYAWTLNNETEFHLFYDYLKQNPLRSIKMHRIRLLHPYFHYFYRKYHLSSPQSFGYKTWTKFCQSWFKYTF
jgi:LAGLIDADG endonuclease